jgi:DNA invertase Pin-like site-specific DNA recombinase
MSPKITAEHLRRSAVVYVRQSSTTQVHENTESQRRQYALADTARTMGFVSVETIDDDLGKSGSGLVERPGFARLVALVCGGGVGAVFCIEASRLARNGRDWHHLIDLCALCGTIVIDPDGAYDPRLMNDRLLLGLKGTMSEYELGLLRQRGNAARDAKAKRGELRFCLPAGYCWSELGRPEIDPDARVAEAVRLVFRKFDELGSARQVALWFVDAKLTLPSVRHGTGHHRIDWVEPNYGGILRLLQNPIYAGAYVFGRREHRTRIVDGRAIKSDGHLRPRERWGVLLRDHHPGYISWEQFERNQTEMSENAHRIMKPDRKAGRGGRALLTGMLRCGRCGRMLRLNYGGRARRPHRYHCGGQPSRIEKRACISVGGVHVDAAVAERLLEALAPHAIDAALEASHRTMKSRHDVCAAIERELDEAKYEAALEARRHRAVDPDKRHVARELEARWEAALERVRAIEHRLVEARDSAHAASEPDRETLLRLARNLVATWNAPGVEMRTKQRLVHILVREVVVDRDDAARETVLTIHWKGGVHTEVRMARRPPKSDLEARASSAVEVVRKLGGHWPDSTVAMTMNCMRCKNVEASSWNEASVRELRARLGIAAFDPSVTRPETVSLEEAARRLEIGSESVRQLIDDGILAATQLMPFAPWQIPASALEEDAVRTAARRVVARRPRNHEALEDRKTLRLPGL